MTYVVTGVSPHKSLGSLVVQAILRHQPGAVVYAVGRRALPEPMQRDPRVRFCRVDLSVPQEIRTFRKRFLGEELWSYERPTVLVNCAAVHHIAPLEEIRPADWLRTMAVNVAAPQLLTQALAPHLETVCNVISNASHTPMTNNAVYNASKGALHILTKQMHRELNRKGMTVFGVSPNKLAGTGMSEYIERRAEEVSGMSPAVLAAKQAASLPHGQETDPAAVADLMAYLLVDSSRHRYLSGSILELGVQG